MQTKNMTIGMRVEDPYGNEAIVLAFGWRKQRGWSFRATWPTLSHEGRTYTLYGVQEGGRGVLLGYPSAVKADEGRATVAQPKDVHPLGAYERKREEDARILSRSRIRTLEFKDMEEAKIRAFWGDIAEDVLALSAWQVSDQAKVRLGELHYRAIKGL